MRRIVATLLLALSLLTPALSDNAPALVLASSYRQDIDLKAYWVSEKYDGVRAYWDGSRLVTRRGNPIHAPGWFTRPLPAQTTLDGELWMGRANFDKLSGIVRRKYPRDEDWREIRYMVFDLPASDAVFDERLDRLKDLIRQTDAAHIQAVTQRRVSDRAELMRLLNKIVSLGGEGLMLRHGGSRHRAGRSDDLLKLKPYDDAEAVVIAHIPGKGRLTGMTGSLLVESPDGRRFRLGSGLSDEERRKPPAIGETVTYRFRGLNKNGLPRFASFLRRRPRL